MCSPVKKLTVRILIYTVCFLLLLFYLWLCSFEIGFPCLFREFFGITCPGCGATRAAISLLWGDFKAAAQFHPIFALAIYPIAVFLMLQDLFIAGYRVICRKDSTSILEFVWKYKYKELKV